MGVAGWGFPWPIPLPVHFDSARVPPPRETSSGAAATQTAQSEHANTATIVPTKEPASRPDRHPPVRVRSLRPPVHYAPFCSTCRVFLAFARVPFGNRPRSEACHAAPQMHGAPPASHTRNTFAFHVATPGRGTPKDAAALPPAARGRPVTNENPQNPRFAAKSTVYNSRKSKVGHSGLRDIQGSLISTVQIVTTIKPLLKRGSWCLTPSTSTVPGEYTLPRAEITLAARMSPLPRTTMQQALLFFTNGRQTLQRGGRDSNQGDSNQGDSNRTSYRGQN